MQATSKTVTRKLHSDRLPKFLTLSCIARTAAQSPGYIVAYLLLLAVVNMSKPAYGAGTWNGNDTLHVPMSWSIVLGSPANTTPNLAGDTDTDAIIWRRHERPTDNIYATPVGMSFRSAINDAWGTFNFPLIADTDVTFGTMGDVNGWDVNVDGMEFNATINASQMAYQAIGRAGIGVTAVNCGLYHDDMGEYVGVIGWGGCTMVGANCAIPYDGLIMVVDNRYLHPSSPDRTFPPSPGDPAGNLQFTLTDPLDQLVGHELGHSLSLPHRADVTALMNPGQADGNGDGLVDNIGLNAAEVASLRANAQNVPGLEVDPPGEFLPGRWLVTRMTDAIRETAERPPFNDLSSVRLGFDVQERLLSFGQQLMGLIPSNPPAPCDFYFLADFRDGVGATPEDLEQIGIPSTRFQGADVAIRAINDGRVITATAWWFGPNGPIAIPGLIAELQTMIVHPYLAEIEGGKGRPVRDGNYPLYDIVNVRFVDNFDLVTVGRPFRVQAFITDLEGTRFDSLDDTPEETGIPFVVDPPSFPHCFVLDEARPGHHVRIRLTNLLPNSNIHGLLGPRSVFNGRSDSEGGGIINFPIPQDTVPGFHLVTVGVDGTALTADCLIEVRANSGPGLVVDVVGERVRLRWTNSTNRPADCFVVESSTLPSREWAAAQVLISCAETGCVAFDTIRPLGALYRLRCGQGQDAVYSDNVGGYCVVDAKAGFTLLANPFQKADASLNSTLNLADDQVGATLYKFVNGAYVSSTFLGQAAGWVPGDTLLAGEAAFLSLAQPAPVVLSGMIALGEHSVFVNSGISLLGQIPASTGQPAPPLEGLPVMEGDTAYFWDSTAQSYIVSTYLGPEVGWIPALPDLTPCDGFFLFSTRSGYWSSIQSH